MDVSEFGTITILAKLIGGAGGTVKMGILTSYDGGTTWVDYCRFADVVTGASAVAYHVAPSLDGVMNTTGMSATPTDFTLSAGKCLAGPPGNMLRAFFVPDGSVTTAVAQTIEIFGTLASTK